MKLDWLPRPSLLWMSPNQVREIRDSIIKLYLRSDERLKVAATKEYPSRSVFIMTNGIHPRFEYYGEIACVEIAWLKISGHEPPCWHVQDDVGAVTILPFNNPQVRMVAKLVKAYSKHFPFYPTDNFLTNDGEPVA